jgi:hypothetical protein
VEGFEKIIKLILSGRKNVNTKNRTKLGREVWNSKTASEIAKFNKFSNISALIDKYEQTPTLVRNALRIELSVSGSSEK